MASNWELVPKFESWAIKYSIWLKKEWWIIKPILDKDWNVETNIHWMIIEKIENIFSNEQWLVIVDVEVDTYARINCWIENEQKNSKIEVANILENLYKKYEKTT
jgi:hypothetical protein